MEKRGIKIAAQNRKAHHDYFVEDRYEAGIELAGTEVKSIRQGHCTEIYARKTRLGRNRRIDELKRPISSSLTSLITIKQIDDTRFRMMGKKSNVLTSKRGA